jgi:hypothetical protein
VGLISKSYLLSIKKAPVARVAYVFDHQSGREGTISKQYYRVMEAMPEAMSLTMGGLMFEDDRRCPPLQAADLIAWQVRRDYVKPPSDQGLRRPELCRLRENLEGGQLAVWNPDKLKAFAAEIEAGLKAPDLWA